MNLFKSISIYTASNISRQAVGFLLIPVITNYLDKGENGDLSTITAIVTMLAPLILLSANGAINLEFFRKDHGAKNYPSYVSSALVNPLWITLLITIIVFIAAPWITNWLEIDKQWILLIPVLCIINVIPNFTSTIYQAQKKPFHHSIYNIGLTVTDLLLAIIFIIGFSLNWEGRLWAMLATKTAFTLIGFYLLWRSGILKNRIQKKYIKDAFLYGFPLIPHVLSIGILDLSDRLFIREMVNKEALGVYDIGYKIGSILLILQASLMMAWSPFFYEKMKAINERNKIYIVSVSYGLMIGLFACCLLLTMTAPLIFKWFIGHEFAGGVQYVFWVALAYVFLGFYKMFAGFLFYEKRNSLLSYIAFFNVITNLGLNYFLIGKFGAIGAAYATSVSFFLFFLITAIISQYIYPMPWMNVGAIYQFIKVKIKGD